MTNFRVVISGNSGDGFLYRIEDVCRYSDPDMYPFVHHEPSLCSARSVDELKDKLKAMLMACEKPTLRLTEPKLQEAMA